MQELILYFINKYSYIGIFLLITIENLFPPIPSEIILTLSGFLSKKADLNLFLIIIFATIGSLVGAIILYYIGYFFKNDIFDRFINTKLGKHLGFKQDEINSTIDKFNNNGISSIFFGRLIPIIRSLISIPAGIANVNMFKFITLTTIGSFIWNTILVLLGNMLGENYSLVSDFLSKNALILCIFGITLYLIIKKTYKYVDSKHIKNR